MFLITTFLVMKGCNAGISRVEMHKRWEEGATVRVGTQEVPHKDWGAAQLLGKELSLEQ